MYYASNPFARAVWLAAASEMLIVLLGTALLILSGFLFQGRISVGNGLGWDGVAYANMAVNPHKSRMRLLLLPIGCACCFL